MADNENVEVIVEFIGAWSRLDADELASYFTDDGCYYNMPARPVKGRAEVRDMIAGFIGDWTSTEWDLINVVGSGDLVFTERLDRTRVGDKAVDLPCAGVFEMENGKIKEWRDYFDMGTFLKAMG